MKNLKFRIYDKTEKRMKFLDSIWNMPDPSYDFDEIQQFTGLLDKHGKEIYEGDIVKETYKNGYSLHEVCFGEYDNGGTFEDSIRGYGWYTKEHRFWPKYHMNILDYKYIIGRVIGNIYENPELLQDNK